MLNRLTGGLLLSLLLSSCHYAPFIKYYLPKKNTGFPRFSKSEHFKGEVNSFRSCYDIVEYDWTVSVFPETERITAIMKIGFQAIEPESTILLDLQKRMKISQIEASLPIKSWKRKDDLLYVTFTVPLPVGETHSLTITYGGKPAILLKEGPIQWRTDKLGDPWISTQTQGVGAHFIMPCKDMLYDEPDRCFIRVNVPDDLNVVANGNLDTITSQGNRATYHWSVRNPINVYNISFNIGHYEKIEIPYTDVTGQDRTIEVYAQEYDQDSAAVFYQQAARHMAILEDLYGPFPWWNDGCKFVQSTLEKSAMEHQSAISMGQDLYNDYNPPKPPQINLTMAHELAHEWWGNSITAYDYCDAWIHEGMATYSEALVIEKTYSEAYYDHFFWRYAAPYSANKRPIQKPCDVRYNSWVHMADQDIYYKASLMLHTFRRQLDNDSLFFEVLKETTRHFQKQNITTTQLLDYINEQTESDFTPLFDLYLKYKDPPTLLVRFDPRTKQLSYRWAAPLNEEVSLKVVGRQGDSTFEVYPKNETQIVSLSSELRPDFHIEDFGYVLINWVDLEDKKGL